jgi:hypothetical protein
MMQLGPGKKPLDLTIEGRSFFHSTVTEEGVAVVGIDAAPARDFAPGVFVERKGPFERCDVNIRFDNERLLDTFIDSLVALRIRVNAEKTRRAMEQEAGRCQ